jgi:hypothetical protein
MKRKKHIKKYPNECPICQGDITEEFDTGYFFKCFSCDWKRYLTEWECKKLLGLIE